MNKLNEVIGKCISYLILVMLGVGFLVVVLRYFFNLGWVWMQEIVSYSHAFFFLLGMAFCLQQDRQVRVDIFYQNFSVQKKALVNLIGHGFLLLPTCLLILYQSFPFVIDSWKVLEGSSAGGGLELVFVLKSLLLVFPLLLILQILVEVPLLYQTWKQK